MRLNTAKVSSKHKISTKCVGEVEEVAKDIKIKEVATRTNDKAISTITKVKNTLKTCNSKFLEVSLQE